MPDTTSPYRRRRRALRATLTCVVASAALAGCGGSGQDHLATLLEIEMQDYRGIASGFEDTVYSARFVASPADVEGAARRLGLERVDTMPFSPGPPGGPGERVRTRVWWHPTDEIADGTFYSGSRHQAGGTGSISLGVHPETGVTYVEVFYP